MHNDPVYIIDGVRTALAKPSRGLKKFTAAQLAGAVIKELVGRNKINPRLIAEVALGNTVSAGTGQNFARQSIALAGLPLDIPAYLVNNVCSSDLQSVIIGAQAILSGQAQVFIAGGAESLTHAPDLVLPGSLQEVPSSSILYDGLICSLTGKHMGEICEALAQTNQISREEQDQFAFKSHQKACAAKKNGNFSKEIVSLPIGGNRFFNEDEYPREKATFKTMSSLPPAFKEEGSLTAGNSSAPCDGACAVMLASQKIIDEKKLMPRARVLGYASVAIEPQSVFTAGIPAVKKCLEQCGLTLENIDLFEICESFAAQAILTQRELNIPEDKMNIYGGDVALGHPMGAAGARILVTLMHALVKQKKKTGIACICFGSGGAIAMAIENQKQLS